MMISFANRKNNNLTLCDKVIISLPHYELNMVNHNFGKRSSVLLATNGFPEL